MGAGTAPRTLSRRNAQLRIAGLLLLIALALGTVLLSGGVSVARVRALADGYGGAAPLAFILISALLTVCFVPGPILAASAGVLFGTVAGTPIALTSALLGAAASFALARWVAHDAIEQLQGPRLARLRAWIARRGFVAVLYARIVPAVPYNSVNYASGLTRMRLIVFLAATALAAAPRTFAYVTFGGSWGRWTSPAMLVAIGLLAALALLGLWLVRRDRMTATPT